MAKVPAFRIAIRTVADNDGNEWWVAVLARIETMDDTLELGRIRRSAANYPEVRSQFMATCKLMVELVLKDKMGITPADWQTQKPMPPSEGRG
jgi:hypothetical protein